MDKKIGAIIGCCFLLAACASASVEQAQTREQNYNAYVALAQAATSVNQSLTILKGTEQAAYPPVTVSEPPAPASYGMAIPASIDWNGPVQPLVQQIANVTQYKLRVLGVAPAIPIVVSIEANNTPVADILRDAGYQCGKRANIVVFPSTRAIELRYAQT